MDQAAEVSLIRSTVAKFFTVYDVKVSYDAVEVLVTPNLGNLESSFEDFRKEMYGKGYIPILDYAQGEYRITVIRKPPPGKEAHLDKPYLPRGDLRYHRLCRNDFVGQLRRLHRSVQS